MKNRSNAAKPPVPAFIARLSGGFYIARVDGACRVMTPPTISRTRRPSAHVRAVMDREFSAPDSAADAFIHAQVQDLLDRCRPGK